MDAVTTEYFWRLADLQRKAGHDVSIVTLGDGEGSYAVAGGVPVYRLPFQADRFSELAALGCLPVLSWSLSRALALYEGASELFADRLKPDVIECVKGMDALIWSLRRQYPTLLLSVTPQFEMMRLDFDGNLGQPDKDFVSALELLALTTIDMLSAPSEDLARRIAEFSGRPLVDVPVYRLSVSAEPRPRPDSAGCPGEGADLWKGARHRILYFGGVDRYKGADVLVKAAAGLIEELPESRVLIAGEEPHVIGSSDSYAAELREEVARAGREGSIAFLGPVFPQARRKLIESSTCVVFAFRYCGCLYHVLEAMAAGVPVVASRVGSIAESFSDGEEILLVEPEDAVALKAGIMRLCLDEDMRSRLVRKATAALAERFSPEAAIASFEALIDEARARFAGGRQALPVPAAAALELLLSGIEGMCRERRVLGALAAAYAQGYSAAERTCAAGQASRPA